MTMPDKPAEDGFEFEGEFYRWHVTDSGKDLMLIDAFAKMPVTEFFATIEDDFDRGRAPILLALMATSMRAAHPEWSVERITRKVMNLSLGDDVEFVDADVEEQDGPPSEGAQEEAPTESGSTSSESKPSSSPTETETSETSSETLLSSGALA